MHPHGLILRVGLKSPRSVSEKFVFSTDVDCHLIEPLPHGRGAAYAVRLLAVGGRVGVSVVTLSQTEYLTAQRVKND